MRVLSMQQRRHVFIWPVLTLAAWRLRHTWFLLLFITLGMIAAVMIVCTIPLLSGVMTTAGLRSTLLSSPESDEIAVYAGDPGISTSIVRSAYNEFAPLFHRYLGSNVEQTQFTTTVFDFSFSPQPANTSLVVYGTAMQQAASHFGKVEGRIARITSQPTHDIEVMMTPATAQRFGLHVGSTFPLSFSYFAVNPSYIDEQPILYSATLTAHLVGLFQVTSSNFAYWQGNVFNPISQTNESGPTRYLYSVVVPSDSLLAFFDHLRAIHQSDAIYSLSSSGYAFSWYYHFLPSRLTGGDLASLSNKINGLQSTMNSLYGDLQSDQYTPAQFPFLSSLGLSGSVFGSNGQSGSLQLLQNRVTVARIPAGIFAILIVLLILFFVSLMTALLVDRQTDVIALLRSRGASSRQIFGALFLQSLLLCLIALIIGVPLALLVTLFIAQRVLPAGELNATNVITAQPLQAMQGTLPYALVVILAVLATMGISLFIAARMDVLSLRQASARSSKRSFWQRFNLDLIAGVLALLGYALSFYVSSVSSTLQPDARTLLVAPISIIAPFFLMLGCLLLFFRFYPGILQWLAHLAERGRGAVSLLAFAHVARSPRQSLRMALLLALATSFALFTLVYSATEAQHVQDIVNYETGADFSAELFSTGSVSASSKPVQVIQQFRAIPGVLSASVGYSDEGYGGHADLPMDVRAVDAATFGPTVIWPSQQDYAQARPLLSKLVALRSFALSNDVVPAIVDQTTLQTLLLHVGSTFSIKLNNVSPKDMNCLIVGVVNHIPTVNTLTNTVTTGGVLVDYQTYLAVFTQNMPLGVQIIPPTLNRLWLHTKSDAASLADIRTALNDPKYHLTDIVDRYLLLTGLQSDPLYLILSGVLALGTITALLLALGGDTLASWVSARTRVVNFASLRALGATSRQIALVFASEQAIVYITGLILGVGFGILMAFSVIPQLTFTDLNTNLSNQQFFAAQSALSTQIVFPPSVLLALLALLFICAMTLLIMVRVITLPLLNQTLRLSED